MFKALMYQIALFRSSRGVKVIVNCRDGWMYDTHAMHIPPLERGTYRGIPK
ncbi:hypothetical protein [uncultured Mediterranean phage uvMED]|nr:hypothetical protein [uncultured Mediterranean phage uvMED]